jgi:hypothetical protein
MHRIFLIAITFLILPFTTKSQDINKLIEQSYTTALYEYIDSCLTSNLALETHDMNYFYECDTIFMYTGKEIKKVENIEENLFFLNCEYIGERIEFSFSFNLNDLEKDEMLKTEDKFYWIWHSLFYNDDGWFSNGGLLKFGVVNYKHSSFLVNFYHDKKANICFIQIEFLF